MCGKGQVSASWFCTPTSHISCGTLGMDFFLPVFHLQFLSRNHVICLGFSWLKDLDYCFSIIVQCKKSAQISSIYHFCSLLAFYSENNVHTNFKIHQFERSKLVIYVQQSESLIKRMKKLFTFQNYCTVRTLAKPHKSLLNVTTLFLNSETINML